MDVVAPIDGTILKRLRESEGVVPVGEPLLEIGEPGRMEIVADLLSTDAVRVSPGAEVLIEQWGGGHTLHGRVRRVEPSGFMKISALGVEEQRVNVIVDFVNLPKLSDSAMATASKCASFSGRTTTCSRFLSEDSSAKARAGQCSSSKRSRTPADGAARSAQRERRTNHQRARGRRNHRVASARYADRRHARHGKGELSQLPTIPNSQFPR